MAHSMTITIDLTKIKRQARGLPVPAGGTVYSRKDKARQNARRVFRQNKRTADKE